jgi:hypothetical protein
MNKLEKLLYRKSFIETQQPILQKAINVYSNFWSETKTQIAKTENTFEKFKLEKELFEAEITLKNNIALFKEVHREYQDYILPTISQIEPEYKEEAFNFKEKAEQYAELEIYGSVDKAPDNVEHIEMIDSFKEQEKLLENLIESITEKLKKAEGYEKALLEKQQFDYNLNLINVSKRRKDREEYYYNVFYPRYQKDMEGIDIKLPKLLEEANEIVKMGIDFKLNFMIQEWEKHKHDKEKVWLFYTALEARLKSIKKEMRRNKGDFKGKMKVAKK